MTGATRRYVVERRAHRSSGSPTLLGPFEYGEALDVQRERGGRVRTLPTAEVRPRHPSYRAGTNERVI